MSEAAGTSNKHFLLDAGVILESWSSDDQAHSALARLLESAQSQGARVWVSALDVSELQNAEIQRLEARGMPADQARNSAINSLSLLFEYAEVMTCHGFEVKAACRDGNGYEHATLVAASEILPKGRTCFVVGSPSAESASRLPCRTPVQALDWLQDIDSAPETQTKIPFVDLAVQQAHLRFALEERIESVLRHGKYILGPEVAELEERLAEFVGVKHCISCGNGTDALQIAQMALDIGPGDEVITPGFGFIAAAETIALLGAKPVFVDIDLHTYNINAARVEAAITDKTRAIMPVSLYGQPADFDEINTIAAKYCLPVIEDGAQSFGATYKERNSCGLTTIGVTSFFPTKPLGGYGDSGACFTDDETLAKRMREIRIHGQNRRYHHHRLGVNSRMDTLQAAILLPKLDNFPGEMALRQQAGERYNTLFAAQGYGSPRNGNAQECPNSSVVNRLIPPWVAPDRTSAFAQYTVRIPNREVVRAALNAAGVSTAVHYPESLYRQPVFTGLGVDHADCPNCEAASESVVSLPMHPHLTENEQSTVAEVLRRALDQ